MSNFVGNALKFGMLAIAIAITAISYLSYGKEIAAIVAVIITISSILMFATRFMGNKDSIVYLLFLVAIGYALVCVASGNARGDLVEKEIARAYWITVGTETFTIGGNDIYENVNNSRVVVGRIFGESMTLRGVQYRVDGFLPGMPIVATNGSTHLVVVFTAR